MELNRENFRAIIYYNFQRQLSQHECLAELLSVFGNEAPHQSTIFRWYGEFKRGRVSLSDDPRVGAPKTADTQENVDAVHKLIIEDRHASLKISKTSIQKNLHEELGVRKLEPVIVSGDELWIYCYEPENKRQSAVWPSKVIRSRSVSKTMVATFASKAGHTATIPLNEQRTVTADWYTTICLPKVITELRKINPERRFILHQDNASSHTAQKTRQYLTEENVELLYSPDLSPNDSFTFPKIKNRLRGQRLQSPEEAVDAFKNAVLDLPANEWNKCFENWFERMQIKMELNREHFRAIIYYNFQRQLSQQECLDELLTVFGNEAPHQSTISRWYGEFKRGRVSLSDDPRVGAPKTAVTQENVDAVRKLIIEDRHVTYCEIEASLKISKTSIQKNLDEEL
ncbi:unnamed protein product [Acanthoscelides obtectus]|uniref:Mos1 transposase HTH domain-containing protein n=1 Tax=Acanthoscelides obtectus TaxID=200917 RepID=A0A9P0M242_ACAOB|nr:unnamed protein product [Acanthoscelides obtectus]CAK1668381.1 Histone-lysine N-methyltransferase SETMAR [Acanthoscelides obtectus]